jgi:hypothetical protein
VSQVADLLARSGRNVRVSRGVRDSSVHELSSKAASYGHLLLLGPADRGVFSRPSEMPRALIEPLFIADASRNRSPSAPTAKR